MKMYWWRSSKSILMDDIVVPEWEHINKKRLFRLKPGSSIVGMWHTGILIIQLTVIVVETMERVLCHRLLIWHNQMGFVIAVCDCNSSDRKKQSHCDQLSRSAEGRHTRDRTRTQTRNTANKIRLAERYFYVTITLAGNVLLTFFFGMFSLCSLNVTYGNVNA